MAFTSQVDCKKAKSWTYRDSTFWVTHKWESHLCNIIRTPLMLFYGNIIENISTWKIKSLKLHEGDSRGLGWCVKKSNDKLTTNVSISDTDLWLVRLADIFRNTLNLAIPWRTLRYVQPCSLSLIKAFEIISLLLLCTNFKTVQMQTALVTKFDGPSAML